MVWVKAKVDPSLYLKIPGNIISIWGHNFEVQQDGSLCMEMHSDFIATAKKAGRITVLKDPPPGKGKPIDIQEAITIVRSEVPVGLTLNLGNYYGAGDLDKLFKKLSKFKRTDLVKFAAERFPESSKIKANLKTTDILDEIKSLIDSAILNELKED